MDALYTVIIASKNVIESVEKYRLFLAPLLQSDKVVFCEWNRYAETFDEMLPDLYDKIVNHAKWRAVIIDEGNELKKNPFDYTGYKDEEIPCRPIDWEGFLRRRKARFANYEEAAKNPLTRLTNGLSRITPPTVKVDPDLFADAAEGKIDLSEFMLLRYLKDLPLERAVRGWRYRDDPRIRSLLKTEDLTGLFDCLERTDTKTLRKQLGPDGILELIRLLSGEDPGYIDPTCADYLLEEQHKAFLLSKIRTAFECKAQKPESIFCLSLRAGEFGSALLPKDPAAVSEGRDSRFTEFNLYPDRSVYLLFPIAEKDYRQYEQEYIRFLTFLLLISAHEFPKGAVRENRVYTCGVELDQDDFSEVCKRYYLKLESTARDIRNKIARLQEEERESLTNEESEKLFEEPVGISVTGNSTVSTKQMMADEHHIGLAGDCPHNEKQRWRAQYRTIYSNFTKFLREPRRAVKMAVEGEFREKNTIKDDKVFRLNEFQLENIEYRRQEEERSMANTATAYLYDTSSYEDRLNKADEELRDVLNQRMSRKTTVSLGLLAGGLFLFGFLPLIFSQLNTGGTLAFSLILTGVSLGIFLLSGLICLFALRRRVIKALRNFNSVMENICTEIHQGMQSFSRYLAHSCNVMRKFSLLNEVQSGEEYISVRRRILKKHLYDVEQHIAEMKALFANYLENVQYIPEEESAFEYDFDALRDYDFSITYSDAEKDIEYVLPGSYIEVPVDYVKSVTVVREEFYD